MPMGIYTRTKEHNRNISLALIGKKRGHLSEDHKEKIRLSHLGEKSHWWGRKHTKEEINRAVETRMRNGSYKSTPELRKKQSEALKGIKRSQEFREKLSKAKKGIPMKEEAKKKLSEYLKKAIASGERQTIYKDGERHYDFLNLKDKDFDKEDKIIANIDEYRNIVKCKGR
jgi:hypothetical protein